MIGYRDSGCPVKTNNPQVLATAYVKDGKTLISVASWDTQKCYVNLISNLKALRLVPSKVKLRIL